MDTILPQHTLDDEIATIQQKVRSEPTDPKWRMGLFQRYCQTGRWQKALEQLQAYARMSVADQAYAYAYRVALQQEIVRERVFRGEVDPLLPDGADDWLQVLALALKQPSSADALRAQALELAPASQGALDDQPFEWIADADSRLGPVCEAIVDGQYQWIPYSAIESIRIATPTSACDLVWLSAGIKLRDKESMPALIPARYPLSGHETDAHLRSALTTWAEQAQTGAWTGLGVRILSTDGEEKSLLDIRRIDFDPA